MFHLNLCTYILLNCFVQTTQNNLCIHFIYHEWLCIFMFLVEFEKLGTHDLIYMNLWINPWCNFITCLFKWLVVHLLLIKSFPRNCNNSYSTLFSMDPMGAYGQDLKLRSDIRNIVTQLGQTVFFKNCKLSLRNFHIYAFLRHKQGRVQFIWEYWLGLNLWIYNKSDVRKTF